LAQYLRLLRPKKLRSELRILVSVAALLALAGCSAAPQAPTPSPTEAAPSTGITVEVWIDQELSESFAVFAEQFKKDTGNNLEVVVKDFYALETEFPAQAADGPDLVIGSNEWVSTWAASGVITQVPLYELEPYEAVSSLYNRAAVNYGLPYATENAALICNADRVGSAPQSWEDLISKKVKLAINPGGDPYLLQAIQSSFGVELFTRSETGEYSTELALGGEAGAEFAAWLRGNSVDFPQLDYTAATEFFATEQTPCWYTGMWSVPQIKERVSFELVAYPLPAAGAAPAAPFAASRAFFLSSKAQHPDQASEFLELLSSDSAQQLIYETTGRQPVTDAFASSIQGRVMRGFMEASKTSVGIPDAALMQHVWGPLGIAQVRLLGAEGNPKDIWNQMVSEVSAKLGN
jgi:arabinogalactan oligomer/maltooligosaccharide transport system substrate-binding protein